MSMRFIFIRNEYCNQWSWRSKPNFFSSHRASGRYRDLWKAQHDHQIRLIEVLTGLLQIARNILHDGRLWATGVYNACLSPMALLDSINRFVSLPSFFYVWHHAARNKDISKSQVQFIQLEISKSSPHDSGRSPICRLQILIVYCTRRWCLDYLFVCFFMLAMYMCPFLSVSCTLWVLAWANLPSSPAIEPRVCGMSPPSNELLVAHQELLSTNRQLKARDQPSGTAQAPIVIDTYIHFVTTKDQAPFYGPKLLSYAYDNQVCLFLPIFLALPIYFNL